MEGLQEFLNEWKEESKQFFISIANKVISKELSHKELKEKFSQLESDKIMSLVYTIKFENGKDTEKILNFINKEAERKEVDFLNKVNKIAGDIVDCKGLRISKNYGIDGIVIGSTGKVKIETIIAGGYNIQRKHFRILVKKLK